MNFKKLKWRESLCGGWKAYSGVFMYEIKERGVSIDGDGNVFYEAAIYSHLTTTSNFGLFTSIEIAKTFCEEHYAEICNSLIEEDYEGE